ncbi:MAG: CHASE2 domain-containing protein [Burkholderiales bacterium]
MRQHLVRIALGLAVLVAFLGHAADFYRIPFIDQLDRIVYDARLRLTLPGGVDDRIVILDIDEKSLATPELGRWPWGRHIVAGLVDKLFETYGVQILGFDVVFAEPDRSSGLPVLEGLGSGALKDVPQFQSALAALRPRLDHDARFAATIKGRPVVLGYYLSSERDARTTGTLPPPVLPAGTFTGRPIVFTSWTGYGANLPEFQAAAAASGHFNQFADDDGINRRVPMLAEYKGAYYEPLALAVMRTLVGFPKVEPGYPPGSVLNRHYAGLEWLEVGPMRIPVDENACALVPYRGPKGSFPYVSLADVYFDRVPVETLKGKIALVGTTAPGLFDLRATPVGGAYPGVEVHANLIAGMIDRNIKAKPAYVLGAEVVLLLVGGLTLAFWLPFLSPFRATAVSLAALALVTGLNIGAWLHPDLNLVLPLAASLLMTIGLFGLNMSYGYFVESRSKRELTERFGEYVPPELVDVMAANPGRYSMEGRNEVLTVLFTDIRDFTSIAEGLDPRSLSAFMNEFLTAMSLVIRNQFRGTLDKYVGDQIMAFWGAPVADARHARQAVAAGLAMLAALPKLNGEFRARGWPEVRIGVGINSGPMRVGDMGSRIRRAYTVMGDAVNLAARLEGLTKHYGVDALVGRATRDAAQDFVYREIDRVRVKGKGEPVAIFEPLGVEGEIGRERQEELKLWTQALKAYRAQNWEQAELVLFNLQRLYPGAPLYSFYAERVARYRQRLPEAGWDGVTSFETK